MANQDNPTQIEETVAPATSRPGPIRTLRVTEEGLADFLSDNPSVFKPGPDTYIPQTSVGDHGTHEGEKGENVFFPGFGTGGNHVGRNLKNKQQPERAIDAAGPNPYRQRKFLGDEFQGMLTFDGKGAPTFYSRFPGSENKAANVKEYRVSIATTAPDFMTTGTDQAKDIDSMKDEAFNGKPFKDVFAPIDKKTLSQIRKYSKQFEAAYGIKLTVGFDLPDAQLTVTGYGEGDPNLLGFAAFPPGINDWEEMQGLGHHPAYMCLNNQYTAKATAKECYDLFVHEFGHTLGLAHPHDLAILNMTRREALTATKMAYTDLKLEAFRHVVTDADGNPVKDGRGQTKYYACGPDEGVLDYGFRKWTANAPVLTQVTNPNPRDPENDLYKGVYDLEAHQQRAVKLHQKSMVYRDYRMLPMVPMLNDGQHTVLKGSHGNDLLDTNPGYASIVVDPASGAKQCFALVEGHMEKVLGITGNNTIITAQHGDQDIQPGDGKNQVQFLYPTLTGSKKITSTGEDTLVLTDALLEAHHFTARAKQGGINLRSKEGAEIYLGGSGVKYVQIINERGKNLFQMDVSGLTPSELNQAIFRNNAWKQVVDVAPRTPVAPVTPITPPVEIHTPQLPKDRAEEPGRWTRGIVEERQEAARKIAGNER